MVVLDQREREIHPSGDTGRSPHLAVAHVDAVGLDIDRREARREHVAHRPVGGRPTPVEQAGPGEQPSAGADRRHPPRRLGRGGEPSNEIAVVRGLPRAVPAGHHQGVDGADGSGLLSGDDQPGRGGEQATGHRHDRCGVRGIGAESIGHREDLERTHDVQAQHPGERDDDHDARIGGGH
jgi:hypothetical protein